MTRDEKVRRKAQKMRMEVKDWATKNIRLRSWEFLALNLAIRRKPKDVKKIVTRHFVKRLVTDIIEQNEWQRLLTLKLPRKGGLVLEALYQFNNIKPLPAEHFHKLTGHTPHWGILDSFNQAFSRYDVPFRLWIVGVPVKNKYRFKMSDHLKTVRLYKVEVEK